MELKRYLVEPNIINDSYIQYDEKEFKFNIIQCNTTNNIILKGYFQSYLYFQNNYEQIYKLLNIEEKKRELKNKINFVNLNIISMHFRLGDYKKKTGIS